MNRWLPLLFLIPATIRAGETAASASGPDLQEVLRLEGDSREGGRLFSKACSRCHRLRGEGSEVGPDLRSIATHPKEEVLRHVVDPDLFVSANYAAWKVETAERGTFIGILKRSDAESVTLVQSKGREVEIRRARIVKLEQTGRSFMPPDLLKGWTAREAADLLAYIKSPL